MNRRVGAGLLALLGVALLPDEALACPCSDDPGSPAFMTATDERYALSLVATSRRALGVFDAQGSYRAFRPGELEASEELLARLALRFDQRLELQAELGASSYRFHGRGFSQRETGLGDALLRWRYRLREEDLPHTSPRWPGLSLSALLRAPLGGVARARSAGFGSGGAQLGLGAWELGAGVDAVRSWDGSGSLWLSVEVAYRFEDERLGRTRQLGPRAEMALGGNLQLVGPLGATVALAGRFTGNVAFAGRTLPGTAERVVSVISGLTAESRSNGFRSTLGVSLDPPISHLSRNAVSAVALAGTLALSR